MGPDYLGAFQTFVTVDGQRVPLVDGGDLTCVTGTPEGRESDFDDRLYEPVHITLRLDIKRLKNRKARNRHKLFLRGVRKRLTPKEWRRLDQVWKRFVTKGSCKR